MYFLSLLDHSKSPLQVTDVELYFFSFVVSVTHFEIEPALVAPCVGVDPEKDVELIL